MLCVTMPCAASTVSPWEKLNGHMIFWCTSVVQSDLNKLDLVWIGLGITGLQHPQDAGPFGPWAAPANLCKIHNLIFRRCTSANKNKTIFLIWGYSVHKVWDGRKKKRPGGREVIIPVFLRKGRAHNHNMTLFQYWVKKIWLWRIFRRPFHSILSY